MSIGQKIKAYRQEQDLTTLSPEIGGKKCPPPGYQAGNCAHTHEGEEWITVLTGKVKVTQGDFSAILEEGDSIHWDGSCPHLCQNAADTPTKVLVALTPPSMLPVSRIE